MKDERNIYNLPIILVLNIQHKHLEKLFKKHCPVLRSENHLQNILPEQPRFVYRRAPTLRDIIAKNVPDSPNNQSKLTCFQGKGFFPCRRCFVCANTKRNEKKITNFVSTSTGREYPIRDFISCRTEGVVYVHQCPCKMQYAGRTKRPMWKRICEHVQNIRKDFSKYSISKHFVQYHNTDSTLLQF